MMKSITTLFFIILIKIYIVTSTEVKPCPKKLALLPSSVEISECDKPPCKFKENTNMTVTMAFTPATDIDLILNSVAGIIVGIPAPFLGVDGTSACNKIYLKDGETPASCPLKAGEVYVYKNGFPVLKVYPKINLVVHWALKDKSTKKDIVCFEVDGKITK